MNNHPLNVADLDKRMKGIMALLSEILFASPNSDSRTRGRVIQALYRAGLSPKDIAEVVGTTPNSVSVALSRERSKVKGK